MLLHLDHEPTWSIMHSSFAISIPFYLSIFLSPSIVTALSHQYDRTCIRMLNL